LDGVLGKRGNFKQSSFWTHKVAAVDWVWNRRKVALGDPRVLGFGKNKVQSIRKKIA
jgi:hypothetical protein